MSRKGHCWNTSGTKKVIHTDLAEAFQHAYDMRHQDSYAPYLCPSCNFYHVGRQFSNPVKIMGYRRNRNFYNSKKQLYDEVLVGKLIAALRAVIT